MVCSLRISPVSLYERRLKKEPYRYTPHGTKPLQINLKMNKLYFFVNVDNLVFSKTVPPVKPDWSRLVDTGLRTGLDSAQTMKAGHMTISWLCNMCSFHANSGLGWGLIHTARQSFTLTRWSVCFCARTDLPWKAFACHPVSYKVFFVRLLRQTLASRLQITVQSQQQPWKKHIWWKCLNSWILGHLIDVIDVYI